MIFQHYTPQTLAWRTSSCLCRSPDQERGDEDHISYFERGSALSKNCFLFSKRFCQRTGSRRMMQTNAAVARFQILLVAEDPKREPTGLGNSTDCGVRGSQRKVKHQNTKKSNTPQLKHKNTGKVKHTSTVIDPMIALWWPSNVSRATYDNLHQLTFAKMITKFIPVDHHLQHQSQDCSPVESHHHSC